MASDCMQYAIMAARHESILQHCFSGAFVVSFDARRIRFPALRRNRLEAILILLSSSIAPLSLSRVLIVAQSVPIPPPSFCSLLCSHEQ